MASVVMVSAGQLEAGHQVTVETIGITSLIATQTSVQVIVNLLDKMADIAKKTNVFVSNRSSNLKLMMKNLQLPLVFTCKLFSMSVISMPTCNPFMLTFFG